VTSTASASSAPAIQCHGLGKTYRRWFTLTPAVTSLELEVPAGVTFGLLGPNGAGKTTTIGMVLGLVKPDTGTSSVFGRSISSPAVRSRVGFVPEKFQLPTYLTADEFMQLHARLQGLAPRVREERIEACLRMAGLEDRRTDRLKGFSKGMQQRMVIAQAMLGRPDLLVLDEPTSALDPIGRREVRDLIRQVRAGGTTVLLNSHLLAEVESVCDQVAILRNGQLVHQGRISDLADDRIYVTMSVGAWSADLQSTVAGLVGKLESGVVDDRGRCEVTFVVEDEARLPTVAAAVQSGGGQLYSLVPRQESLEDLFMRVVGADAAAREGAAGAIRTLAGTNESAASSASAAATQPLSPEAPQ
jgi:ABC-2 type transport system ATP-binding protein